MTVSLTRRQEEVFDYFLTCGGTVIRSDKYPDLDGLELTGKQILEIPSSNQSLSNIQVYVDLAKNKYGIEIRFRGE